MDEHLAEAGNLLGEAREADALSRAADEAAKIAAIWNQRYAAPGFVYGKEPNAYFKFLIDRLPPGRVLLPGEGQGRNSAYAAARGWDVLAFDASPLAREQALSLAAERGVTIRYELAKLGRFDPGSERFDLIAMVFIHMLPELRAFVHRGLVPWLAPGGYLLVEAFAKAQLHYTSGGPPVEAALFSPELLQADFSGIDLLELHEVTETLAEGDGHRGPGRLVRLIGQKT